jgi:hypothetical protein
VGEIIGKLNIKAEVILNASKVVRLEVNPEKT